MKAPEGTCEITAKKLMGTDSLKVGTIAYSHLDGCVVTENLWYSFRN
jgi:hypothetical protein